MEKDIAELKTQMKDKVACSLFDDETEKLKNLINSLASNGGEIKQLVPSGPSLSSKDLNEIKEVIKKVAEHEEKLQKMNLDALLKRLKSMEDDLKMKADKTDIFKLESDKAEKLYVEGEFKRVQRELD